MKHISSFFFGLALIFSQKSFAQNLYASLDWSMAAVVSNNDYTNGSTDGTPAFTFGANFDPIAVELTYKKYGLNNSHNNYELEFQQTIIGLGARFNHGPFLFSRFGLHYLDIESLTEHPQQRPLNFPFDGTAIGFYLGGGLQIPFTESFAFQTAMQLETSKRDLTILGALVGFKYSFMEL